MKQACPNRKVLPHAQVLYPTMLLNNLSPAFANLACLGLRGRRNVTDDKKNRVARMYSHSCTIRLRIRYGKRIRYAYRTAMDPGLPYRCTSIRLYLYHLIPFNTYLHLLIPINTYYFLSIRINTYKFH